MPTHAARQISSAPTPTTSADPLVPRTHQHQKRHLTLMPDTGERRPSPPPALTAVPETSEGPSVQPTLLLGLAILAVEVLEGLRNMSQLQGFVTREVSAEFRQRVALHAEQRALVGDKRRTVPQPVGMRSSRPTPTAVEAAVVLRNEARAFAVVIRLDYSPRRNMWRASCLTVL